MFLQYYGLREQPFGVTPNPRYLYHSPAHREALASLIYGIEADLGFAALIADPGMGKTTLLFYLLEKFRSTARTALVFQTQCNAVELLRYVANELDVEAEQDDPVILFDRIRDVLVRDARAGRRVIVIIDEAQNLSEEALEAIRLLSDFETPEFKLLHIILAGQPPLAEKLARPSLAQLLQRIAMLNRLVPFSEIEDISKYIAYRMKVAGYSGPPLFNTEALELIAEHSRGVPRQINRLCFNALSIGCATKRRLIDASIIREVLSDLDVGSLLGNPGSRGGGPGEKIPEQQSFESRTASISESPFRQTGRPATQSSPRTKATSHGVPQRTTGPAIAVVPAASATAVSAAEAFVDGALALSPSFVSAPVQEARQGGYTRASSHGPQPMPTSANGRNGQTGMRVTVAPPKTKTRVEDKRVAAVPTVKKAGKQPLAAPNERTSLALIVLFVVAVPLLVLAAWLYLERQHLIPGTQAQPPAVQQNVPENDHGSSVDLPQSPEPAPKSKPKRTEPGKRSELFGAPVWQAQLMPASASRELARSRPKLVSFSRHLKDRAAVVPAV